MLEYPSLFDTDADARIPDPIVREAISVRAMSVCRRHHIYTTSDLADIAERQPLISLPGCGRRTANELEALVAQYRAGLVRELAPRLPFSSDELAPEPPDTAHKYLSATDFTPEQRVIAEHLFEERRRKLPVRASNVLNKLRGNAFNVSAIIDNLNSHAGSVESCGRKTCADLRRAFGDFGERLKEIAECSGSRISSRYVQIKFPYLSPEQSEKVALYHEHFGYYPVFRMLHVYLGCSSDRATRIFDMVEGITGERLPRRQVALQHGLSAERIRQIVSGFRPDHSILDLAALCTEEAYPELAEPVVVAAKLRNRVVSHEFGDAAVPPTLRLITLMLSCIPDIKEVEGLPEPAFCTLTYHQQLSSSGAIDALNAMISARASEDRRVHLGDLCREKPDDSLIDALRVIVVDAYHLELSPELHLLLPRNSLDVTEEMYKVLRDHGAPMSREDLLAELLRRCPDASRYNVSSLRAFLLKDPRISAMGKRSTYALNEWGLNSRTVRGSIRWILEQSDTPLALTDIIEHLKEVGVNSTAGSISGTISSDDRHGFCRYPGHLIGLCDKEYPAEFGTPVEGNQGHHSFYERLRMYTDFADTHRRLPYLSPDEYESSLARWLSNIKAGNIRIESPQIHMLEEALGQRAHLRTTTAENRFINGCYRALSFINSNPGSTPEQAIAGIAHFRSVFRYRPLGYTEAERHALNQLHANIREAGLHHLQQIFPVPH